MSQFVRELWIMNNAPMIRRCNEGCSPVLIPCSLCVCLYLFLSLLFQLHLVGQKNDIVVVIWNFKCWVGKGVDCANYLLAISQPQMPLPNSVPWSWSWFSTNRRSQTPLAVGLVLRLPVGTVSKALECRRK